MPNLKNNDLPDVVVPTCEIRQILTGQKALVTGASSGIGKAVAIALGRAGADVIVNYLSDEDGATEAVNEIKANGQSAIAVKADVSNEDQVLAMFDTMYQEFKTIDILVNNAGLQQDAPFHEMTLEQWQKVIDINLTGQFLCSRSAVREFIRRGVVSSTSSAAGKVINMSSVHELIPWAGHANYAASKGGVMQLTKSMAQELARLRIRVNSVCPGAIRTPINKSAWETQEAYDSLMNLIPYNRIGETDDISRSVVWLASDESDYINGTSMFVDGGMNLFPGFASGG